MCARGGVGSASRDTHARVCLARASVVERNFHAHAHDGGPGVCVCRGGVIDRMHAVALANLTQQ